MCVIWTTDVGRALKFSMLLLVHTRTPCDSSFKAYIIIHGNNMHFKTDRHSVLYIFEALMKICQLLKIFNNVFTYITLYIAYTYINFFG